MFECGGILEKLNNWVTFQGLDQGLKIERKKSKITPLKSSKAGHSRRLGKIFLCTSTGAAGRARLSINRKARTRGRRCRHSGQGERVYSIQRYIRLINPKRLVKLNNSKRMRHFVSACSLFIYVRKRVVYDFGKN